MGDLLLTEKEMNLLEPLVDAHRYCTQSLKIDGGRLLKGNVRLTWSVGKAHIELSEHIDLTGED